jgi:hypothetical protein
MKLFFKKSLSNCFPQPSLQLTLAEAIRVNMSQSEERRREESKVMVLPMIADGVRVEELSSSFAEAASSL